jgi:hypothetical protein
MFVFLVISGVPYEGENVVGVFSDYVKARECELKYVDNFGYTEIRKVEVDKIYDDVFGGIGEEV